jgi:hypothetical protein
VAEETIIKNVGEDDTSSVASEATLLQLLATMEQMAKAAGLNPASTRAKVEKQINEALKANIKDSEKHSEALKDKTKATEDATKATRSLSRIMGGLLGTVIGSVTSRLIGFTGELLTGGDRLSDFTQHIPAVGSLITPLAKFIEETVDNFRSLSSVGAAFGNSLADLKTSATIARLPLDEFSSLIRNNSERLIFLGSSVTEGARRFSQIAGVLRGNDGLFGSLKAMGFTTEEVNEGLANYINLQGRLGRIQGRTNAELAAGAAEYLHQMDRLAKATGKQRQEIEKELERLNLDAAMLALENQIIDNFGESSAEHRAFRDAQTRLAAMPEEMREAAISSMMGLPDATAAVLGSDFIEGWRGLATGAFPDPADAYAMIESSLKSLGEAFDDPTVIRALQQSQLSGAMDILSASRRIREILNADLDKIDDEQLRRDGIIENLTRFDDRIRDIRATIQAALIDSGVFDLVARSMSSLAGLINGPKGTAAIRNGIDSMVSFFKSFIDDVSSMGFWEAIKKSFFDLLSSMMKEIKLHLFGGTRDTSEQQDNVNIQIRDLESRRNDLRSFATPEDVEGQREINALDAQIKQLRSRSTALAEQHGQEIEGMLSGMFSGMFSNLFGSSNRQEIEESLAPVNDAIRNLEEQRNQLITQGEFGIVDENTSAELERINQELTTLNEKRDAINAERQSGFLSELFTLENMFSAGGALMIGLAAGATAIALISTKAALVAVAIGFAAGGIGYLLRNLSLVIDSVFKNMATVIDSVGESLTKLINSFSGLFTDTINALTGTFESVFNDIGNIIESIGDNISNIVGSFSGLFTDTINALTGTFESVFNDIGNIIESIGDNISNIIDSLSDGFTSAVQALKPMVDTVFSGISQVIDSVGGTIEGIIGRITDGISNIISKITEFRTAGTDATTNQIERLSQIESERLVAAAEGITAMKAALEGFGSGATGVLDRIGSFFGAQTSQERQTSSFERLANLGPGLTEVSQALTEIAGIENISENVNSLAQNLDSRSLRDYNSELSRMLDILRRINEELSRDTRRTNWRGQVIDETETANPASNMLSSGMGSNTETVSRLDRLNTTMTELLRIAQEQLDVLGDIDDNTDGLSGDISRRGITSFGR